MWYPGSGVVLDCIDSSSLIPDLCSLSYFTYSNSKVLSKAEFFYEDFPSGPFIIIQPVQILCNSNKTVLDNRHTQFK